MKKNYKKLFILILLLILPIMFILIAREIFPNTYLFSSIYKLIYLFPIFYGFFIYKKSIKKSLTENFNFKTFKKNFIKILTIGLFLGIIYLDAYLIFKGYLNLNSIANTLSQTISVSASNIIIIGLYIIIFNSLFEEFFWRGFIFKEINNLINPITTPILTGIAFSLHHIIFYYNFLPTSLTVIATIGLIIYTIIMNYIFIKYQDLFSCWLIHAIVDIIQIGIGLKVFGVI